ncbi:hypothetical protein SAY86_010479 [Trapa natans]|uniref:Uncharacterized protein n=1 Tax=Trapa natans TaxID=22666 RepID=A0AAN7R485_TRANT|nr:hypothetical protein SAY86_010479 [Trapa natans]
MDLFSLQSVILLFLTFLYFYFFFSSSYSGKKSTGTDGRGAGGGRGIKNYPILGSLPDFFKNRSRFLDWTTGILASTPTNTLLFVRPGASNGIITANPANVEHILKTRFENYPKGERFIVLLGDFLGKGIFNSDGELWRIQRKTASYEFNSRSLRNFIVENVRWSSGAGLSPSSKRRPDLVERSTSRTSSSGSLSTTSASSPSTLTPAASLATEPAGASSCWRSRRPPS